MNAEYKINGFREIVFISPQWLGWLKIDFPTSKTPTIKNQDSSRGFRSICTLRQEVLWFDLRGEFVQGRTENIAPEHLLVQFWTYCIYIQPP